MKWTLACSWAVVLVFLSYVTMSDAGTGNIIDCAREQDAGDASCAGCTEAEINGVTKYVVCLNSDPYDESTCGNTTTIDGAQCEEMNADCTGNARVSNTMADCLNNISSCTMTNYCTNNPGVITWCFGVDYSDTGTDCSGGGGPI